MWGNFRFQGVSMDMVLKILRKVNGPALPKERCINVDTVPPENNGSEKKHLTMEAHPPHFQDNQEFWKNLAIEPHDTIRHPTLYG